MDYVDFGTSTSLMNELGINQILRYSHYNQDGDFPSIGVYDKPLDFDVPVGRMRMSLAEPVLAWKNHNNRVKKVGVLTGAGHSTDHLKYAFDQGYDTYITGEASLYTIQYAHFIGLNLLVGSHTLTEIFGVERLARQISKINDGIRITQLKENHLELNHR